jgi:hypothetical protein
MESSKEETQEVKRHPFNFGIQKMKRELKAGGMSKSQINKTVRLYKEKLYARIAEVKAKMDKEMLDATVAVGDSGKEGTDNATNQ